MFNIIKNPIYALVLFFSWSSGADYSLSVETLVPKKGNVAAVESGFLESYRAFCQKPDFDPQIAWETFSKQYPKAEARKLALEIKAKLSGALNLVKKHLPTAKTVNLRVMILVGCNKTDATALLGKNKTYVFFDVGKLFEQKREKSVPTVFLVHELLHGIQFSLRPEFAPANYRGPIDDLMKYMIAEGSASFFAQKITRASDIETYWLDILDSKQYLRWRKYTVSEKPLFAKRIKAFVKNPKAEPQLLSDLFYVLKFENLEKKRAGYLYGAEIMRRFDEKNSRGMDFSYEEIEPVIREYFGI